MPIVYPAKVVEKIREVIKEVIKAVGFSPSVSIGMEMTIEPTPPTPQVIASFGLDIGFRLYSLRLYLPYPITYQLITNPSKPTIPTIYSWSLDSGLNVTAIPLITYPSYTMVSNPTLPSVTLISSFSLDAYGEVEMGNKPSISTSIVSNPDRPTVPEIREFSTSVGVRKSP
jgi:hypothetical protein